MEGFTRQHTVTHSHCQLIVTIRSVYASTLQELVSIL